MGNSPENIQKQFDVFELVFKNRFLPLGKTGFLFYHPAMNPDQFVQLPYVPVERKRLEDWGLVLEAAHIRFRTLRTEEGNFLLVRAVDYERAMDEIHVYEKENRQWPPVHLDTPVQLPEKHPPTLLILILLGALYMHTGPWKEHNVWFQVGALSTEQVVQFRQWWRVVTALTLHADPVHLLGNLAFGGVLIHSLCMQVGRGTGWLLTLIVGALGNAVNVRLHEGPYQAVGFSTAVFGVVGLLVGIQAFRRERGVKGFLLPFGSGLALLAFLGSQGQHTDLGAHLWGFVLGTAIGSVLHRFEQGVQHLAQRRMLQNSLLWCVVAIVFFVWEFAFRYSLF